MDVHFCKLHSDRSRQDMYEHFEATVHTMPPKVYIQKASPSESPACDASEKHRGPVPVVLAAVNPYLRRFPPYLISHYRLIVIRKH